MRQTEKGGEQYTYSLLFKRVIGRSMFEANGWGEEPTAGDGGSDGCRIRVGTFGQWEYTCRGSGGGTLSFPTLDTNKDIGREAGNWLAEKWEVKEGTYSKSDVCRNKNSSRCSLITLLPF